MPSSSPLELARWFNGTHLIVLVEDANASLGIRVLQAEASPDGSPLTHLTPYKPSQATYWRDLAEVLAEGYRR